MHFDRCLTGHLVIANICAVILFAVFSYTLSIAICEMQHNKLTEPSTVRKRKNHFPERNNDARSLTYLVCLYLCIWHKLTLIGR